MWPGDVSSRPVTTNEASAPSSETRPTHCLRPPAPAGTEGVGGIDIDGLLPPLTPRTLMRYLLFAALLCLTGVLNRTAAEDKKPDPKEPDLTTKAAEDDPDFKIQGEYAGEVPGKGKYAAQVVALGAGKFDVYFLAGG